MTRSGLIRTLSARHPQFTADDTELAVRTILDAMKSALVRGDRIEIRGFGSFSLKYKPPGKAHNPKTGEILQIKAKRLPHFKAGGQLRARVDTQA